MDRLDREADQHVQGRIGQQPVAQGPAHVEGRVGIAVQGGQVGGLEVDEALGQPDQLDRDLARLGQTL
jgi:hypothetical protein